LRRYNEGALVANYPWDGTPDSKTRYARVGCCNLKLGETRVETRVETCVETCVESAWFQRCNLQ
jgi:hypothetical protein